MADIPFASLALRVQLIDQFRVCAGVSCHTGLFPTRKQKMSDNVNEVSEHVPATKTQEDGRSLLRAYLVAVIMLLFAISAVGNAVLNYLDEKDRTFEEGQAVPLVFEPAPDSIKLLGDKLELRYGEKRLTVSSTDAELDLDEKQIWADFTKTVERPGLRFDWHGGKASHAYGQKRDVNTFYQSDLVEGVLPITIDLASWKPDETNYFKGEKIAISLTPAPTQLSMTDNKVMAVVGGKRLLMHSLDEEAKCIIENGKPLLLVEQDVYRPSIVFSWYEGSHALVTNEAGEVATGIETISRNLTGNGELKLTVDMNSWKPSDSVFAKGEWFIVSFSPGAKVVSTEKKKIGVEAGGTFYRVELSDGQATQWGKLPDGSMALMMDDDVQWPYISISKGKDTYAIARYKIDGKSLSGATGIERKMLDKTLLKIDLVE